MRHVLFPVDELSPGEMRRVIVDGVAIVVLKTPTGEIHALRDSCAHYGARLSIGLMQPKVISDKAGRYERSDAEFVITCPWHGYEYEVASGRCPADPERVRVRTYKVSLEDGRIVVERRSARLDQ